MPTQFLVIGKNDDDREAAFALLTRKVFSTYEEAKQHADQPERAHRNPQVVECHFPIMNYLAEATEPRASRALVSTH